MSNKNNQEDNSLWQFLIGTLMLGAGLYWFMSSVTVTTGFGFGTFMLGTYRMSTGGLVVVPFIAGIVLWFYKPKAFIGKLVTILGVVVILASVIMNTNFIFQRRNLYEYLIMLVFIFGGGTMVLRILLKEN